MATGTIGKSLKGHPGVFLSRDGGLTWRQVYISLKILEPHSTKYDFVLDPKQLSYLQFRRPWRSFGGRKILQKSF